MPQGLSAGVAAKWNQLVADIQPGLLRQVDVHQLRLLAELLHGADVLAARLTSDPTDEKARRLFLGTCDRVQRLSSMFGLSPVDRARMKIDVTKPVQDPVLVSLFNGGLH